MQPLWMSLSLSLVLILVLVLVLVPVLVLVLALQSSFFIPHTTTKELIYFFPGVDIEEHLMLLQSSP